MDYKKAYEKALIYLAEEGCPTVPMNDTRQDRKCLKCMENDADVFDKRIRCWNKKFTE